MIAPTPAQVDVEGLIQSLHMMQTYFYAHGFKETAVDARKAASALAALRDENAALRKELDAIDAMCLAALATQRKD